MAKLNYKLQFVKTSSKLDTKNISINRLKVEFRQIYEVVIQNKWESKCIRNNVGKN